MKYFSGLKVLSVPISHSLSSIVPEYQLNNGAQKSVDSIRQEVHSVGQVGTSRWIDDGRVACFAERLVRDPCVWYQSSILEREVSQWVGGEGLGRHVVDLFGQVW